jgi:hypothetical protein
MVEVLNKQNAETKMVQQFIENFYNAFGYYPTIIIKTDKKKSHFGVISLTDLEKCFQEFLPKKYGKIHILSSTLRVRKLVELRFIFFHIARKMGYGLKDIGQYLGKRDHTTVIHGLKTFRNLYETDENFKNLYYKIVNIIKNNYESSIMDNTYTMEIESKPNISA